MTCFHILIVVSEHFIVMTKDYINCERTYFIIFDDDRLVYADSRQRSTMLPTLCLWISEMAPPCRSLPQPSQGIL